MTVVVTPYARTLFGLQRGRPVTHHAASQVHINPDTKTLHLTNDRDAGVVAFYAAGEWADAVVVDTDERTQLERLAEWIAEHVPGEPSRSEGVIDTVIRLLIPVSKAGDHPYLDNADTWGEDRADLVAYARSAGHGCLPTNEVIALERVNRLIGNHHTIGPDTLGRVRGVVAGAITRWHNRTRALNDSVGMGPVDPEDRGPLDVARLRRQASALAHMVNASLDGAPDGRLWQVADSTGDAAVTGLVVSQGNTDALRNLAGFVLETIGDQPEPAPSDIGCWPPTETVRPAQSFDAPPPAGDATVDDLCEADAREYFAGRYMAPATTYADTPQDAALYGAHVGFRAGWHRGHAHTVGPVDPVPVGEVPASLDGLAGLAEGRRDPAGLRIGQAIASDPTIDPVLDDIAPEGSSAAFRAALRAASRVADLPALLERIEDLSGMSGEVRRITQLCETAGRREHEAVQALDMAREVHRSEMSAARAALTEARHELDAAESEVRALQLRTPTLHTGDRLAVEDEEGKGVAGTVVAWTTAPGGHPFIIVADAQ